MFKRTEEGEWSRFAKALAPRAPEARDPEQEDDGEARSVPETLEPEFEAGTSPSRPRAMEDVNLSRAQAGQALPPAPPAEVETVISERSSFEGTFRTEEPIRIRGTVCGQVESAGAVVVEAQARVSAKVIATEVTVAGHVDGQIACTGRVELTPSARVTGEIAAGTLIMQEGAFFEGQLTMASSGAAAPAIQVTTER